MWAQSKIQKKQKEKKKVEKKRMSLCLLHTIIIKVEHQKDLNLKANIKTCHVYIIFANATGPPLGCLVSYVYVLLHYIADLKTK